MIYTTFVNEEKHNINFALCVSLTEKYGKKEAEKFVILNSSNEWSVEIHDDHGPLWFGEVEKGAIEWTHA